MLRNILTNVKCLDQHRFATYSPATISIAYMFELNVNGYNLFAINKTPFLDP